MNLKIEVAGIPQDVKNDVASACKAARQANADHPHSGAVIASIRDYVAAAVEHAGAEDHVDVAIDLTVTVKVTPAEKRGAE